MANFNLQDYETVAERIIRFYNDHPDGRIITSNETTAEHRAALTWVMSCAIFLNADDLERALPKATGWAFEIDGSGGMANKTSALENCETSAIGRALANANYGGDKRTSREEMAKVERDVTPQRDWLAEAHAANDKENLKRIYNEARQANLDSRSLSEIAELGKSWNEKTKQS
jgi:hypothetical protein